MLYAENTKRVVEIGGDEVDQKSGFAKRVAEDPAQRVWETTKWSCAFGYPATTRKRNRLITEAIHGPVCAPSCCTAPQDVIFW